MFSALKKLTSGNSKNEVNGKGTPEGLQTMHASLQKKFAKGVHYNMKIIIRGDRNVGKTCLFHRLQGKGFIEEYNPTQEIQVASIHWSYKATDDIVKVEVWDVVDKGKKKKPFEGLKLNTTTVALPEEPALDAEFLDVYKGTHGVIMMLDITKQWTFDYIKRELPKIPRTVPVIVLANHRDMGHHRCISEDDIKFFIESLDRKSHDAQIRFGESSMRNSFGLKLLHKFFNLPFLALQRDSLLKQLDTNTKEMELTNEELNLYLETEDASYDKFMDLLTQRRRQNADALNMTATSGALAAPVPHAPVPQIPGANLTTSRIQPKIETTSGTISELKSDSEPKNSYVSSVEDFVVEGEQDLAFLSSVDEANGLPGVADNKLDSESEEEPIGNPMVMGFQDEIDDEDFLHHSKSSQPAVQMSDSSDEDEEILRPIPAQPIKISQSVAEDSRPAVDAEEDLDNWLNDSEEPSLQPQVLYERQNNFASELNTKMSQVHLETRVESPKDTVFDDVDARIPKKSKDKKVKSRSKKSKKERITPEREDQDFQPSRPIGDYEEI